MTDDRYKLDADERKAAAYALGILFGMTDNDDEEQLAHDAYHKLRDGASHDTELTWQERIHEEQVLFKVFHNGIVDGTKVGDKREAWNKYRKERIARKALADGTPTT